METKMNVISQLALVFLIDNYGFCTEEYPQSDFKT